MTKQSKPITLLGGLTSFGGAGNNYSMHVSITVFSEDFLTSIGLDRNGSRIEKREG
jgi:hypothetical protein